MIGRMFSPSVYEGWGIYLGFDQSSFTSRGSGHISERDLVLVRYLPFPIGPYGRLDLRLGIMHYLAFLSFRVPKNDSLVCLSG